MEKGFFFQRRFIDDDFNALGLDALHDPLNNRSPEIIGVTLHRQPIDTDDLGF